MRYRTLLKPSLGFLLLMISLLPKLNGQALPHLAKQGSATQLIIHGQPFLILGGELGNSTATTLENMQPVWPKLKAMHLNTALMPVYWELVEPEEGQFDFSLYRDLIQEARRQELKLVLLWFGSWKNSMSSHAPAWVKLDRERFPRVKDQTGRSQEILSSFSQNVFEADRRAFAQLMTFLRNFDGQDHTVITFQHREDKNLNVGLLKVDEGHFENGDWTITHHLNGDQPHQGRHVNIGANRFGIQRVQLYIYR